MDPSLWPPVTPEHDLTSFTLTAFAPVGLVCRSGPHCAPYVRVPAPMNLETRAVTCLQGPRNQSSTLGSPPRGECVLAGDSFANFITDFVLW